MTDQQGGRGAGPYQEAFLKEVQTAVNKKMFEKTFMYEPDRSFTNIYCPPRIESYYLKKVLVCHPLKQFEKLTLNCHNCGTGVLKSKGWATKPAARYVHGLDSGKYTFNIILC